MITVLFLTKNSPTSIVQSVVFRISGTTLWQEFTMHHSEQNLHFLNIPERCQCDFVFAKILAILEQSSLLHASCLKHSYKFLAWAERYANIISNTSNRHSTIVQNHFLHALRPGWASSLTSSRPSLNRLYHKWTYVLLILESPNVTVNMSLLILFNFLRRTFFDPFFRTEQY